MNKTKSNHKTPRLKPIPTNTVVHTPTETEAKELLAILHENGYKWYADEATEEGWENFGDETCYRINSKAKVYHTCDREWYETICLHCILPVLTLAEFKERYCEDEKPQPKLRVGDIVRIIDDCGCNAYGLVGVVESLDPKSVDVTCGDIKLSCLYEWIEPYTEPETKPTEDMKAIEKQKGEKGNNSESSQLNLCELLERHEGESIFLTTMGEVLVEKVSEEYLSFQLRATEPGWRLNANGKMRENGVILAFPSRALYKQYPLDPLKAWSVWQEEQMNRKAYIQIYTVGSDGLPQAEINDRYYFRTPADRDKCLEEIKAIIEKYSKK